MTKKSFNVWALFASVYVTQYIGVAFILASTVAIMRKLGMPLDKIALINIIALPLLLKIFYAPFIDNIRLKRFIVFGKAIKGQYRSWLLVAQFLMMLLLLGISTLDIVNQFGLALLLMLVYGFAVSMQDIAIDGLACQQFVSKNHHYVNSIQFAGNLLGNVIGGGLILMAYAWLGWQGSLLVLSGLTAISWLQLLFFKEETSEELNNDVSAKKTSGYLSHQFKMLWGNIKTFITIHKSWFLLLLLYPLSISAGFSLINPLLVDAGWVLADIGFVTKVFGSIVGIISALLASVLVSKIGKNNALVSLSLIQAFTVLALVPLAYGYTSKIMVYIAVAIYFLVNPALMTVIATFAMQKASKQSDKATFFTLQLGVLSFLGFAYAGIAMALANYLGYGMILILVFLLSLFVFYQTRIILNKSNTK